MATEDPMFVNKPQLLSFHSRISVVGVGWVKLERALPYNVSTRYNPVFHRFDSKCHQQTFSLLTLPAMTVLAGGRFLLKLLNQLQVATIAALQNHVLQYVSFAFCVPLFVCCTSWKLLHATVFLQHMLLTCTSMHAYSSFLLPHRLKSYKCGCGTAEY